MSAFRIVNRGSTRNTRSFLSGLQRMRLQSILDSYGREGVIALASATPVDSGVTAASWYYEVETTATGYSIRWLNSHVENGVPIAIILQLGHGTGTGGYVQGRDYINPALRPIFDRIEENVWKAVTSQ